MEISESVTHTLRYPPHPPLDFPSLVHVDKFNFHLIEASMHRFMMNELTGNYAEERGRERGRRGKKHMGFPLLINALNYA